MSLVACGGGGGGHRASSAIGVYGPHLGYRYQNKATVSTGIYGPSPYAQVWVAGHPFPTSVPANYMGAHPRLYRGSALCASGPVTFNPNPAISMERSVTKTCGPGSYRASGTTIAFNSHSPVHASYATYLSPALPF